MELGLSDHSWSDSGATNISEGAGSRSESHEAAMGCRNPDVAMDKASSSALEMGGDSEVSAMVLESSGESEVVTGGVMADDLGMQLEGCGDETRPLECTTHTWVPGRNCGNYDTHFKTPIAQALVTNIYLNLCRLPAHLCKSMHRCLLPNARVPKRNFADLLAADLQSQTC